MTGDTGVSERHRHPVRVSWTGLQRWEHCNMQDHLVRDGKRSPLVDTRVFLPGKITDLAMRQWLEQDDHKPGTLVKLAEPFYETSTGRYAEGKIKWKGDPEKDKAFVLSTVRDALTRLEPWLWENVLPYEYEPEMRGRGVVGIPDEDGTVHRVELTVAADIAVRRAPDRYRIYDLKTTRNADYVRGKTLGQLTFYKIATAALMGVSLRDIEYLAFVTPLTPQIEVPTYPDVDDVRVMMTRITQYVQGIWSGEHPPKDKADSDCLYRCDVRKDCPLFAMARQPGTKKISLRESASRRRLHGRQ